MPVTARHRIAFAAAVALAGLGSPAVAQTATDLACKGCVGKRDIGKNAVTGAKIRKNTVRAKHLHRSAKPAGVASASSLTPVPLTGTYETVFSVSLTAPGPGTVVATASFNAHHINPGSVHGCTIVDGTTAGLNTSLNEGTGYVTASLTRPLPVAAAGPVAVNLMCTEAGGNVEIDNINLIALFVPASY